MASNLVKFCTAALAGSLLGIAYERMPPSYKWPNLLQTASAASSIVPRTPIDGTISKDYKLPDLDPQMSAENLKHSSKYGLPSNDNLRLFDNFIISYDRRLRSPIWVFEHLTPEKLKGDGNRKYSKFVEDPAIHEYFRAKDVDFRNSGYDRGHMAAAGNNKVNQNVMDQTFALSNISPQSPKFNQGVWEQLEKYVRYRANRSKNLYVVTGPLFLPMKARDGNLYVTYRVLGNNHISVPTHYFKVFLVETKDGNLEMEAFLMPNDNDLDKCAINEYRVNIDRLDVIERAAGILLFNQLPRDKIGGPSHLVDGFKCTPWEDRRRISDAS